MTDKTPEAIIAALATDIKHFSKQLDDLRNDMGDIKKQIGEIKDTYAQTNHEINKFQGAISMARFLFGGTISIFMFFGGSAIYWLYSTQVTHEKDIVMLKEQTKNLKETNVTLFNQVHALNTRPQVAPPSQHSVHPLPTNHGN